MSTITGHSLYWWLVTYLSPLVTQIAITCIAQFYSQLDMGWHTSCHHLWRSSCPNLYLHLAVISRATRLQFSNSSVWHLSSCRVGPEQFVVSDAAWEHVTSAAERARGRHFPNIETLAVYSGVNDNMTLVGSPNNVNGLQPFTQESYGRCHVSCGSCHVSCGSCHVSYNCCHVSLEGRTVGAVRRKAKRRWHLEPDNLNAGMKVKVRTGIGKTCLLYTSDAADE